MKRFTTLLTAVVFGGLVMQTALVSAKGDGNGGNRKQGNNSNQSQSSQQSVKVAKVNKSTKKLSQQGVGNDKSVQGNRVGIQEGQGTRRPKLVQANVEAWKKFGQGFGSGKCKDKDQADLGPGRPDGRVEVVPTPSEATLLLTTPSSRPGYVWNNGHWERAKSVVPATTAGRSGRGSDVPYGSYGVTPPPVDKAGNTVKVTVTPGSQRDRTIYGTGPGPHSLWDLIHPTFPELTLEQSRDHRTPSKSKK